MKRRERQPWALWVRLDQLPGFIMTPFVAQLFLFSAAFPEGRAVIPALLLMPLSEQRGDLLTQWVGNHWQNILSKMHCATWCSSIPALRSGKSSSAARHSLVGSSRVCLVIINWCFQLLQLHMGKRKCELWCESVCTGALHRDTQDVHTFPIEWKEWHYSPPPAVYLCLCVWEGLFCPLARVCVHVLLY